MNIFKEKVAVITGSASGIGRALAENLADRGARVVLSDLNKTELEQTIHMIKSSGGDACGEVLDVTDYNAFKKHLEQVVEEHGRIDYLFNNAGIAIAGEVRDMKVEHWQKVVDVDLNGVFYGSLIAYQQMVKQGFGHIINLSSIEGLMPFPANAPYVASKYAVLGLSQTMWMEGRSLGIKVSAVCPGVIRTPIFDVSPMVNINREKMLAQYSTLLKLGVTPEKCAKVILKGVMKDKPIILVTGFAHILWRLVRLSPIALMKMARRDYDKWRDKVRVAA